MVSAKEIAAKSGFAPNREATLSVDVLSAGSEYVLVPCTFRPGERSKFWVTIFSEHELAACNVIDTSREQVVAGEWRGATAGGCYNHDSFVRNPQYLVQPKEMQEKAFRVNVVLEQEERAELRFISLYASPKKITSPADIKHKLQNTNLQHVALSLTFAPAETWVIMPNTFDAGEEGAFRIILQSPVALTVSKVA